MSTAGQRLPLFGVEAEEDLPAVDEDGTADEIGVLGHEAQGVGAGGRVIFQIQLAVDFIACVEEGQVVAVTDDAIELLDGESLVEVDGFGFDVILYQETPGFAAGGSSGFGVELHGGLLLS